MESNDAFDLARFLTAQEGCYERVLAELRNGRKTSHWIWFIFPQVKGLGRSSTSAFYAIGSLDEAQAYVAHLVLGPRLLECTETVNSLQTKSADQIFGGLDAMKFRSSMTLFARAAPDPSRFVQALEKYFGGQADPQTASLLKGPSS